MLFTEITVPENLPFSVALGLMLALGCLQVISLLAGMEFLSFADQWLPDFDAGDGGVNLEAAGEPGIATAFLSWLNLGKVPLMVTLIAFLFIYAFIGLNVQGFLYTLTGLRLPALVAGVAVFVVAVPPLKVANSLIAKIMPRDETSAISPDSFIGRVATITIGTATAERPAEARIKGPLGRTHYIMVLPDESGRKFGQGEQVLVVGRTEHGTFKVIEINNPNLETTKEIT